MTLLGFLGFDDNGSPADVVKPYTTINADYIGGRLSGYALRLHGSKYSGGYPGGIYFDNIPSGVEIVYGFAFRKLLNSRSSPLLCQVLENGESSNPTVHMQMYMEEGSSNRFRFRVSIPGQSDLITDYSFLVNNWYYCEWKLSVSDTAGTCEFKVDGTTVLAYSGPTTNVATSGFNAFRYYCAEQQVYPSADLDDTYLILIDGVTPNDYLGDVRVVQLEPTGNGSSSGFTNSAGTSVDNYTYVDSASAQSTTYVETAATGVTDLYAMSDLNINDIPIAMQSLVYAWKTDAGTYPPLKPTSKGPLGTVRTDTDALPISVTKQNMGGDIYLTDPDGNALTADAINNSEFGVTT